MKIKVRDVSYDAEINGQGEPILFLHGFTGSAESWREIVEVLKENYQCITIDLLGHGKTDAPTNSKRYTMEEVCADIAEILTVLELSSVHLVGYSMGGRVALSFAMLYKNRVRTLLLESTSPGLLAKQEQLARIESDQQLADFIEEKGMDAFVTRWENIPLFSTQQLLSKERKQQIRAERMQHTTHGLANSLRGMGTGQQSSWWEQLGNMNKRTLLMCGELDKKFCHIAQQMKKILPNSEIFTFSNSGHAIHVEQNEIFGKIVERFLKGENKWNG